MPVRYSVVIVSYNCKTDLNRCLLSLFGNKQDDSEIIIVDNASSDGTLELIQQFPKVVPILNTSNQGFSKACNQGAEIAKGQFLVFLNPDTVVSKDWLSRMSNYFENPEVGAVGPVSNYVAGTQKYEFYSTQSFSDITQINEFSDRLAQQNGSTGIKTKLLIGFCLMIRKDVFNTIGQMDEALFLGNDDLDLSWRLSLANYLLIVATDVFIFHEGQKSFNSEPNEKTKVLVQESTDTLYQKLVRHYGSTESVPSSKELWGMAWFQPSEKAVQNMRSDSHSEINVDPDYSWLCISESDTNQKCLDFTTGSINPQEDGDAFLISQSDGSKALVSDWNGIKLDVPSSLEFNQVFEMGINLVNTHWVVVISCGVEATSFLKLAIPRLIRLTESDWISFPIQPENSSTQKKGFGAFAAKKSWLKSQLAQCKSSHQSITQILSPILSGPSDIDDSSLPVLPFCGDFPVKTQQATAAINTEHFPTSLQPHLQSADYPHFSDCSISNTVLFDGSPAQPEKCDLLILRVKPAEVQVFKEVLPNITSTFPNLKRLITLYLPDSLEIPVEQTIRQLSDSCWMNRYQVDSEEIYSGLPTDQTNSESEKGWQLTTRPRSTTVPRGKSVSIVILGFNQMAYSKKCIESITAFTKPPYQFILIDNGSQDGTAEYFKTVPGAKVIINSTNLGVAKGWNQGLKEADGDYILILNNDVIATPYWLDNMLRLAEVSPQIGIVGPRTNNISGPQLIPDTNIRSENDIQDFAKSWVQNHELSAFEYERIVGFAMLIKQDVFQKVGYFDEQSGTGNFEDDDYCLRARYHGYKLMVANDSFLFHFGSVSFKDSDVDWKSQMLVNQKKFQDKWTQGSAAVNHTISESGNDNSEFQLAISEATNAYQAGDLTLAKTHYTKAAELSPDSPEAHVGLGILAYHDAAFPQAIVHFKNALEKDPSDEDTALNIIDCLDQQSPEPQELANQLTHLSAQYPNQPVFNRAIEEKLGQISDAPVHWREHVEEMIRQKRYSEALDILENLLRTGNELAFCYNYLGIIAFECNDTAMAWDHFQKSIDINLLDEDILLNYHDAGIKLGHYGEVLGTLEKAFSYPGKTANFEELKQCYDQLKFQSNEGSWDPEKAIATREMNIAGENLVREGLMDKATEVFDEILGSDANNFRAMNNKGLLAWYAGSHQEAWKHFTRALQLNPGYSDALINAFDVSLKLRNIDEFRFYLDKFLEVDPHNHDALDLLQSIVEKKDSIYQVANFESIDANNDVFDKAMEQLNQNQLNEATLSFLDIIEIKPEWFAPYNGLGIIAYKKKMFREAFKLFEKAVELNPLDENSLMNLWTNASVLGIESDVVDRLVSAVQVDPGLQKVQSALNGYST